MMFNVGYFTRRVAMDPKKLNFAVIDIETTGLDPERDHIVEFAVINMRGTGEVAGSASTLVQPPGIVPEDATAVHGLTTDSLRCAPTFSDVADDICALLSGSVVVAHNMAFDGAFLASEFTRSGLEGFSFPAACTQVTAYGHLIATRRKLSSLYRLATGRGTRSTHQAEVDAAKTATVLSRFIGHTPNKLFYKGAKPQDLPIEAPFHPSAFTPRKQPAVDRFLSYVPPTPFSELPPWHANWAPREVPAEATWEWGEIRSTRGMTTVSPPTKESLRKDWNGRESGGAGRLGDLPPESTDAMIDALMTRIRGWRTFHPERRSELKRILLENAKRAGGDLNHGFKVADSEAQKTYLCERDVKHHRIGSTCTTSGWSDETLIAYLEGRLRPDNPRREEIEVALEAARSRKRSL
ncbi:hypothetical protein GCM10009799_44400 [Nocardiopsis rhodophaea]|uniref:Exonuclease domain-containing protein n=1 Tax=Nocardiopsis rhodophaea TaxID=280238 RepID=A0ABP5F0M2_9ACTN